MTNRPALFLACPDGELWLLWKNASCTSKQWFAFVAPCAAAFPHKAKSSTAVSDATAPATRVCACSGSRLSNTHQQH